MVDLSVVVADFVTTRVLALNPLTKSLVVLGTVHGVDTIVLLEKTAFVAEDLFALASEVLGIELLNTNDVYAWALGQLSSPRPQVKVNVISPASETHIRKYDLQTLHVVRETPAMYREVVAPYIATMRGDRIKWVRNILFDGAEADKVVERVEDPVEGYVLLPDMKWDGTTLELLYLCAIVLREDIALIRDLTREHVPWLERLLVRLRASTSSRYGVAADQLRVFVHYQPLYYHFHIHVVNSSHPGLGDGIAAGKAIMLEEVIELLQHVDYADRTVLYVLGENHVLWSKLQ